MAKPARNFEAVALTANQLASGAVVYRTATGAWSEDFSSAVIARSQVEAEALLAAGLHDVGHNLVVEAALIELAASQEGMAMPRSLRERIRASGPTVAYAKAPQLAKAS